MFDVEPFYGWHHLYISEEDENSPFYGMVYNAFEFDRYIYTFPAHPLWDTIDSESLLIKVLFVDYSGGYAIIELIGEWNDLFENDFKLFTENCLLAFTAAGIDKFILICENVFNIYLENDEYYNAFQDEIPDGWIALIRARDAVLEEITRYGLSGVFYWTKELDLMSWRKMKPDDIFEKINVSMRKALY